MNAYKRFKISVLGGMPVGRRVVSVRVTKPGEQQQEEEGTNVDNDEDLSESYTNVMQERMGAPLVYRHEDGMNYTRILDDLIVGSCLQTEDDVDTLVGEGVSTVMCLQENSDMEYFSLDIDPVRARCSSVGTIDHVRHAIRDFDPYSLRRRLPGAVALCAQNAEKQGHGTLYVHCTAGLGRAPATALAYMWWFKGIPLDEAYDRLTSLRPCKPRVESIREAALDLLFNNEPIEVKISLKRRDSATDVRVAGLDVGWGQTVPLATRNPTQSGMLPRAWLKRRLPPGKFQFKFIWDGEWGISMDHLTMVDGDNVNNVLIVPEYNQGPDDAAIRQRIRSGGDLLPEEREKIQKMLLSLDADRHSTSAPADLTPGACAG